jgi:hypothetical protein
VTTACGRPGGPGQGGGEHVRERGLSHVSERAQTPTPPWADQGGR